ARHWFMFRADEGRNLDEALDLARKDLELRKDVFAYDALAWSSFKKGLLPEAERAMAKALERGSQFAALYHHAGMIARARGDQDRAGAFFAHARALKPAARISRSDPSSRDTDETPATLSRHQGCHRQPRRSPGWILPRPAVGYRRRAARSGPPGNCEAGHKRRRLSAADPARGRAGRGLLPRPRPGWPDRGR